MNTNNKYIILYIILITFMFFSINTPLKAQEQDLYVGDEINSNVTTSEDVNIPASQINKFLSNPSSSFETNNNTITYPTKKIGVNEGDTFVIRVAVGIQTLIHFSSSIKGAIYENTNDAFSLFHSQKLPNTNESINISNQLFITAKYPNQNVSVNVITDDGNYNFIAISLAVNSNNTPDLVVYVDRNKNQNKSNIRHIDISNQFSYSGNDEVRDIEILKERINPVGADLKEYLRIIESLSANDFELAIKSGIFNDNYLIVGGSDEFKMNVAVFDNNKFTYLRFTDDQYRVNFGSQVNTIHIETSDYSRPVTNVQVIRNFIYIKEIGDIIKIILEANLPDNKPPEVICIIRNKNNKYKLRKEYVNREL